MQRTVCFFKTRISNLHVVKPLPSIFSEGYVCFVMSKLGPLNVGRGCRVLVCTVHYRTESASCFSVLLDVHEAHGDRCNRHIPHRTPHEFGYSRTPPCACLFAHSAHGYCTVHMSGTRVEAPSVKACCNRTTLSWCVKGELWTVCRHSQVSLSAVREPSGVEGFGDVRAPLVPLSQ